MNSRNDNSPDPMPKIRCTVIAAAQGTLDTGASIHDRMLESDCVTKIDVRAVFSKLAAISAAIDTNLRLVGNFTDTSDSAVLAWACPRSLIRYLAGVDAARMAEFLDDWNRRVRFIEADQPLARLLELMTRLRAMASQAIDRKTDLLVIV